MGGCPSIDAIELNHGRDVHYFNIPAHAIDQVIANFMGAVREIPALAESSRALQDSPLTLRGSEGGSPASHHSLSKKSPTSSIVPRDPVGPKGKLLPKRAADTTSSLEVG